LSTRWSHWAVPYPAKPGNPSLEALAELSFLTNATGGGVARTPIETKKWNISSKKVVTKNFLKALGTEKCAEVSYLIRCAACVVPRANPKANEPRLEIPRRRRIALWPFGSEIGDNE